MSSSSFGTLFRVTTFGESHGAALGAVVDGAPAGLRLDETLIQIDLDRRKPGRSPLTSARREPDRVRILSGIFEDKTTGAPIALVIDNADARPSDYESLADVYRPGSADFTVEKKYGFRDPRGGGRSSGRETVGRVAAGAVARALLKTVGIEVLGATHSIAGVRANLDASDWRRALDHPLRCPDAEAAGRMEQAILEAKKAGDSVGGVVEVRAHGLPVGLGEPVFGKLGAQLGAALLSIGAVKGVEIGDGFALTALRGSQANDPMGGDKPRPYFLSNHAGGILGGISNGETVVVRAAVKPTPSISAAQQSVRRDGTPVTIEIPGRHDPCIVPRLVAVAEAMVCLVLADALLTDRARRGFTAG